MTGGREWGAAFGVVPPVVMLVLPPQLTEINTLDVAADAHFGEADRHPGLEPADDSRLRDATVVADDCRVSCFPFPTHGFGVFGTEDALAACLGRDRPRKPMVFPHMVCPTEQQAIGR
jgi:hypothetical protein